MDSDVAKLYLYSGVAHIAMWIAVASLAWLRRRYSMRVTQLHRSAIVDWSEWRYDDEEDEEDGAVLVNGGFCDAFRRCVGESTKPFLRSIAYHLQCPKRVWKQRLSVTRPLSFCVYACFAVGSPITRQLDSAVDATSERKLEAEHATGKWGHSPTAQGIFGWDLDTYISQTMVLLVLLRGSASWIQWYRITYSWAGRDAAAAAQSGVTDTSEWDIACPSVRILNNLDMWGGLTGSETLNEDTLWYVGIDGLFCFILLYDYILNNYNAII